jgi:hypothetical protein
MHPPNYHSQDTNLATRHLIPHLLEFLAFMYIIIIPMTCDDFPSFPSTISAFSPIAQPVEFQPHTLKVTSLLRICESRSTAQRPRHLQTFCRLSLSLEYTHTKFGRGALHLESDLYFFLDFPSFPCLLFEVSEYFCITTVCLFFWLHKMGHLGSKNLGGLGKSLLWIAHIDLLVYTVLHLVLVVGACSCALAGTDLRCMG